MQQLIDFLSWILVGLQLLSFSLPLTKVKKGNKDFHTGRRHRKLKVWFKYLSQWRTTTTWRSPNINQSQLQGVFGVETISLRGNQFINQWTNEVKLECANLSTSHRQIKVGEKIKKIMLSWTVPSGRSKVSTQSSSSRRNVCVCVCGCTFRGHVDSFSLHRVFVCVLVIKCVCVWSVSVRVSRSVILKNLPRVNW